MPRLFSHFLFALLFLGAPCAQGAFRVGLGDAVAKRSAALINSITPNPPVNAVGDRIPAGLPTCPAGAIYDSAPTDLSTLGGIEPLGHVAPPPHTFPSDHIYLYGSTTTAVLHPAYAPAMIHVTDIASTEYLSASPVFTDYAIYFYACSEVKSYYGHIKTLSPAVQSQLASAAQNCFTYTTGGSSYRRCDTQLDIVVRSGELIGYGSTSGAFDFGTYDYRIPAPSFAAPARHAQTDSFYTVCPLDYFTAGPKAAMEALVGRFDGGYHRTVAPICGQYNHDVAGSARGFWYHPGSPNVPEDPHLSLIIDNVYAPKETISIGTSLPNQTSVFYTFIPSNSGLVDRELSQVVSDGNIYCYDTFYDPLGQLVGGGHIFILQMTSPTTLRFESQPPASCGSGPWAFTSNAVDFQR